MLELGNTTYTRNAVSEIGSEGVIQLAAEKLESYLAVKSSNTEKEFD